MEHDGKGSILEKLMVVGVLGRQNGLEWGVLAEGRPVKILGIT